MRFQIYQSSKDLGFVIQLQLPVSVGTLLDPECFFPQYLVNLNIKHQKRKGRKEIAMFCSLLCLVAKKPTTRNLKCFEF
jgi:hypothetical protein